MPTKNEVVSEQLEEIRQDLRDLWVALRHDPKKQKRKERMWSLFSGALAAGATMVARQAATKIWTRVTGEPTPQAQKAQEDAAQVRQETHEEPAPAAREEAPL
jgi:peptidoglycan hydrolase CwlO-like protein